MSTFIYIGGFRLPDGNAAAQRVLNNARILRRLGHQVLLVGVSGNRPYDHRLHPADGSDIDVNAWEMGYPASQAQWFDMIRADWPLRQAVAQEIVRASDVTAVVCYNHPAIAQRRIAKLARNWGALAIADCTEWYANRPWTSPANIIKNCDTLLRMHIINRQMDALITTSPFITRHYADTGLPIVEIPTLIDPPQSQEGPPLPVDAPLPLIAVASGFVSSARAEDIHDRIDWVIELLAAAAARGADFRLRIVGVDHASYLSVFPQHAALLDQLGEKVELLGRRPRNEVLQLLGESAFSFVLRHESRVTLAGFPTKYSESVTHGTPVIINDLPSVRAYHVEGQTGYTITPEQPAGAVDKLCSILAMERAAIDGIKHFCRYSGIFHSDSFIPAVRDFLTAAAVR